MKRLENIVGILILSNVVSWLMIAGIIFALFNHSHSLGSLI